MKTIQLLLMTLVISFTACKKDSNDNTPAVNRTVSYQIRCTDCFVSCTGPNGVMQNFFHQNDSFAYSFEAKAGDTLLLVAQNTSNISQTVTGTILLNGGVRELRSSSCPINGTVIVSDTLN
ncbi:MAG: hypothetical protein RIQ47_1619 [Bacteroidota bacterium]|jgi:hypothetical protein